MLAKVRQLVMSSITRGGTIEAWIIEDTSFPKKGRHSVRIHHQYTDSSASRTQVAMTPSIANHHAGLPIARVYLPREWFNDRSRRAGPRAPARSLLDRSNAKSGQKEDN
jgi:SRSO17 transposase